MNSNFEQIYISNDRVANPIFSNSMFYLWIFNFPINVNMNTVNLTSGYIFNTTDFQEI